VAVCSSGELQGDSLDGTVQTDGKTRAGASRATELKTGLRRGPARHHAQPLLAVIGGRPSFVGPRNAIATAGPGVLIS